MATGEIPTRAVLGIPIVCLELREISNTVINLITEPGKKTFFYVNGHCLNIANRDPVYRKILQGADLVYADGMGPILASKILGRPLLERTPTPDFIGKVFTVAIKKKWSIYLLGGEGEVVKKAQENLQKRFKRLQIAGYHHGFFKKNEQIIKQINRAGADIILVGMGTPRQEKWIAQNKNKVNAKAFWAVGALFEIFSNKRKRAPKWMQQIGLEWTFRLIQDPKRLWRRYLLGNITFLLTVFGERAVFFRKSSH